MHGEWSEDSEPIRIHPLMEHNISEASTPLVPVLIQCIPLCVAHTRIDNLLLQSVPLLAIVAKVSIAVIEVLNMLISHMGFSVILHDGISLLQLDFYKSILDITSMKTMLMLQSSIVNLGNARLKAE